MISENKVKLNEDSLFKAMAYISEDVLTRSEQSLSENDKSKSKRITSLIIMAASLFIVFGVILYLGSNIDPDSPNFFGGVTSNQYSTSTSGGCNGPEYSTSTSTSGGCYAPETKKELKHLFNWKTNINKIKEPPAGDKAYAPGSFTEGLDQNEIAMLLPSALYSEAIYSGKANFNGEGKLIDVNLRIAYEMYDNEFYVTISENNIISDYLPEGEALVSSCNGVDFTIYRYSIGEFEHYEAYAEIQGLYFKITTKTIYRYHYSTENILKLTLERLASYTEAPDLSKVEPSSIPYFEDKELSFNEAKSDATYGNFIPAAAPSGFNESSFKRYIDGKENYLAVHYYNGLDYVDIKIIKEDYYDIDYHERTVSINEEEKYDLSLYPIPRADTVPKELYEVVDNPIFDIEDITYDVIMKRAYSVEDSGDTDSLRMKFTVCYHLGENGLYFVEVNSKGAEPFWILETLRNFR